MGRRGRGRLGAFGALVIMAALASPSTVGAADEVDAARASGIRADLDGRPIDLVNVGRYYCHDFAYPQIHCFSRAADLEARASRILDASSSSLDYAIIYDFATFAGPYMYMSQDYTVLAWIGWNDRIGSFLVRNSQSGKFWTDWFFGGSYYGFCCNQQVTYLGVYDNTFSSVYRN
jgi:hypothetical protein